MSATHSTRAGPALRRLAEADPALAALSLWCAHRDGAVTQTSGGTITYGPDFEAMPLHEQMGLAGHHILHVALRHPARLSALAARLGPGFDETLYNLAADAMVNEAILAADHALPRPAATLTGLLKEALGVNLPPETALAEWDVDRLYFALAAAQDGDEGAGGKAKAYALRHGFEPDLEAQADDDGTQEVEHSARWRQHMARAMQAGRQAGRGLGGIGYRLADIPEPRTPWEVILRRLLSKAVMVAPQVNPARPARRWIAGSAEAARRNTAAPGFEAGRRLLSDIPRIVVGVDASSSVDDARLAMFWGELCAIARRLRAEIHVLVFDDAVRHRAVMDLSQQRPSLPELPRGGGTTFPPVIAEAQQLGAAALVMLTDLEGDPGPAPKHARLRVIWAVPSPVPAPPFGHVIDLSA